MNRKRMGTVKYFGKAFIIAALALVLGAMLPMQKVRADVIWEPRDSFYTMHREECVYINRLYYADGPDGKIIVYKSPENPAIVKEYENGTEIHIAHVYKDKSKVEWGVYEGKDQSGWIPMDYLEPIYDYICFEEEFGDEIVEAKGTVDKSCIGKNVYFWNAPGSPNGIKRLISDYAPEYAKTYTDEKDRTWGFTYYYMGIRNKWICLDDLTGDYDALWKDAAPRLGEKLPKKEEEQVRIVPGGSPNSGVMESVILSVILVGATIIVSLLLLKKLKRDS